jgi:putative hemolysin
MTIRTSVFAAAAMLVAACAPNTTAGPGSEPDRPTASADAVACASRGGAMTQVGRMHSWQCVIRYADAGRRCTDGDQCQGDCRVEEAGVAPGATTAGVCQASSNNFGCNTSVEDGRAGATLCID